MIEKRKFKSELIKYLPKIQYRDISKNSTDYFRVMNLNDRYGLGKNSFRLDINKDNFVQGSTIWIDITDSNGNVIYHEISDLKGNDNTRLVVFYIYATTPPGPAYITIAGRRSHINGIPELYSINENSKDYYNIPNIYWQSEISIIPNENNFNEIIYESDPIVEISEVTQIYRKPTDPADRKIVFINNDAKDTELGSISIASSGILKNSNDLFESTSGRKKITDPIIDGTKSSSTLFTAQSNFSVKITNRASIITDDMIGGRFTINDILNKTTLPNDIDPLFVLPTVNFSSTINKIMDVENIELTDKFSYLLEYKNTSGAINTALINSFNTNEYSIEYFTSDITLEEKSEESYIDIKIKNLQPIAGNVNKIELAYKPYGTFGEVINLGKFNVNTINYFVDFTEIVAGKLDIEYKPIWNLPASVDYNTYWNFTLPSVAKSLTTKFPKGLDFITSDSDPHDIEINLINGLNLVGNVEYVISGKMFNDTFKETQFDVYVSDINIETDVNLNLRNITPHTKIEGWSYIGSINFATGALQEFKLYFNLLKDNNNLKVKFKGKQVKNVSVSNFKFELRNEIGYSPNYYEFKIPLTSFKKDIELIVFTSYYNDSIKAKVETTNYGLVFTGKLNIDDVKTDIGKSYTWTAYSDAIDGKFNFSTTDDGQRYIGHIYNQYLPTPPPSVATDNYVWSLRKYPITFIAPGISTAQSNSSSTVFTVMDWNITIRGSEYWNDTHNAFKNIFSDQVDVVVEFQGRVDKADPNDGLIKFALLDATGSEVQAKHYRMDPFIGPYYVSAHEYFTVPSGYMVNLQFRSLSTNVVTIMAYGSGSTEGKANYFTVKEI